MNCCDANGKCTCGNGQPSSVSCDDLGVCQERFPRCGGCMNSHDTTRMKAAFATGPELRHDLAPGVVEGYKIPFWGTRAQRREWWRLFKATAYWVTFSALAGLAAGLISGGIQ